MTDEEGQLLRETAATTLVIRDLIIQLLSYESRRRLDHREFFEELAKMTTARIATSTKDSPLDATTISFQEMTLRELDYILSNARRIATEQS